jgi:signal transduction histidine kinase
MAGSRLSLAAPAWAERVLEPLLASLLGMLVVIGWVAGPRSTPWAVLLDLAACITAALGAFLPRTGPLAFVAVLSVYAFIPNDWLTLGELAALIPILGMGVRRQKRLRRVLAPPILVLVAYRSVAGQSLSNAWGYIAFWTLALAAAWLVGDAFARSRAGQRLEAEAALAEQRTQIARDLHDVVAHDLSNMSLRAQHALLSSTYTTHDLEYFAQTSSKCVDDMRRLLRLLRANSEPTSAETWQEPDIQGTLSSQMERLRSAGFAVTAQIEGDISDLTGTIPHAVIGILVESCNNILRHADAAEPCVILMTRTEARLDLAVISSGEGELTRKPGRLGIIGMQERAEAAGGALSIQNANEKWIVSASFPIWTLASTRPVHG